MVFVVDCIVVQVVCVDESSLEPSSLVSSGRSHHDLLTTSPHHYDMLTEPMSGTSGIQAVTYHQQPKVDVCTLVAQC